MNQISSLLLNQDSSQFFFMNGASSYQSLFLHVVAWFFLAPERINTGKCEYYNTGTLKAAVSTAEREIKGGVTRKIIEGRSKEAKGGEPGETASRQRSTMSRDRLRAMKSTRGLKSHEMEEICKTKIK